LHIPLYILYIFVFTIFFKSREGWRAESKGWQLPLAAGTHA
jgi:hypothetical protein